MRISQAPKKLFANTVLVMVLCAPIFTGCAVTEDNVHRWEETERGPGKLEAVLTHSKYSDALRTEAALSLIRMPSRSGQRLGQKILFEKHKNEEGVEFPPALLSLSENDRKAVLDALAPSLIKQIEQPPPPVKDGQAQSDPSIPYKDAAFALVTSNPPLLSNKETQNKLTAALIKWTQTGFEQRIENGGQQFGIEQMMRALGAPSVKNMPNLINEKAYRVDRMSALIADLGDAETKERGATALVALSQKLESPEWVDAQKKLIDEANKQNKTNATPEQLAGQVKKFQSAKFSQEIFPAMKKLATQKPIVNFLVAYAGNTKNDEERRKLALAALEGKMDKNNKTDLDKIFEIVKAEETPDGVRDLGFMRLGEFSKADIVPKLYTLFDSKKWKVRWVAAELAAKAVDFKDIPEFLNKLPSSNKTKAGMTEGLSYAHTIVAKDNVGADKARELLVPRLNSRSFGERMTAIGFFFENGKKSDESLLKPLTSDKTPVPQCEKDEDCQWQCELVSPGKETQFKEVKTLGEVVEVCILPRLH